MSCPLPAVPAPALKDLPKVAGDLKSELESFKSANLKNADTQEKIILPSAEGNLFTFACNALKRKIRLGTRKIPPRHVTRFLDIKKFIIYSVA